MLMGSFSLEAARMAPATQAAPPMSARILSMSADGLIEMPPLSTKPTNAHYATGKPTKEMHSLSTQPTTAHYATGMSTKEMHFLSTQPGST